MERVVDLRSDTVTVPTEEMREAMRHAVVGDDVYEEDPTVKRLEKLAAEKLGKEAGLFVVSGTMGNQTAILTHTQRGDEAFVEAGSHTYLYEVGAMAMFAGVQPVPLKGVAGRIEPEQLRQAVRPPNIHWPRARLLCLENTHNRAGGTVMIPEHTARLAAVARELGLVIHLDGARIFNAAVALGVDARELARDADSVMFCLSKGLGAPVGSVLVSEASWIERARKWRKALGGGMRQAGVIAAAGIVALEKMVDRLSEDHANARVLAEGISHLAGIRIDLENVQTNIVIFDVAGAGLDAGAFVRRLGERGVKAGAMEPTLVRMVTHKDVSREDIHYALRVMEMTVRG